MQTTRTEFISNRRWESYKRRCENAEIRRVGRCRRLGDYFGAWIVEYRMDHHGAVVRDGWREAMKHAANCENTPIGFVMDGAMMRPA